jgi:alpha-1,3-rhamnosyl/mannosyltransferase
MAASAKLIFTDSEFSRAEIASRLRVEDARLKVVLPGVSSPGDVAHETTASRDPLVLYVGTILNRRNLPELIAAFARVAQTRSDARLVIVGGDRTWPPQDLRKAAAAFDVKSKVELRSYVSHDHLRDLYARASVFAFLSEYEGFGLTPLEALTAGVPIVVLDTPIAREVYGGAAAFVGAGDIDGTAAAILRFLHSRDAAREQLALASEILGRYSWDRAADDTLQHIEGLRR